MKLLRCRDIFLEAPTVELRLVLLMNNPTSHVWSSGTPLYGTVYKYEWFKTSVNNTSCPPLIRIAKKIHICVLVENFQ